MNATPSPSEDRAADEAIDWIILLAEEPDDQDLRARFDLWFGAGAENQAAWRHANKVSALVGQSQNVAFLDPSVAKVRSVSVVPQRRSWRWAAIAGAAIAACLAVVLAPEAMLHLRSDHRTGTAEQQTIALEDGSHIRLAPRSAISVSFADGERRIHLLSGEAYFEVARNEHKPFKVWTDRAVTTVLGTGFDVRQGKDATDVSVRHGRVQVERLGHSSERRILTAGQWASAGGDGLAVGEGVPELVGSWSAGQLAVVDRPVGEVIADIRGYYHGIIIVSDKGIAARSASGSFNMADPVAALVALVRPHGATIRQITPWIIIVSS
ncbi:FecR domain-containing protein [Sphingobium sp. WCS2017Hpa-17]|uniref:FecR family protein n=1 Tax=Sphingobium sp. WCS2017Hpa-17 TaxID=3073638 RepID=UPI00288917FE|nr:FecR domain-containing protein [Sphingobium sp. WCS2017Hpa-17]